MRVGPSILEIADISRTHAYYSCISTLISRLSGPPLLWEGGAFSLGHAQSQLAASLLVLRYISINLDATGAGALVYKKGWRISWTKHQYIVPTISAPKSQRRQPSLQRVFSRCPYYKARGLCTLTTKFVAGSVFFLVLSRIIKYFPFPKRAL